jgi:hypothetical protein
MHALVSLVQPRFPRLDALHPDPQLNPPQRNRDKPAIAVEAQGGPLSLRMASGNPYSQNDNAKNQKTESRSADRGFSA